MPGNISVTVAPAHSDRREFLSVEEVFEPSTDEWLTYVDLPDANTLALPGMPWEYEVMDLIPHPISYYVPFETRYEEAVESFYSSTISPSGLSRGCNAELDRYVDLWARWVCAEQIISRVNDTADNPVRQRFLNVVEKLFRNAGFLIEDPATSDEEDVDEDEGHDQEESDLDTQKSDHLRDGTELLRSETPDRVEASNPRLDDTASVADLESATIISPLTTLPKLGSYSMYTPTTADDPARQQSAANISALDDLPLPVDIDCGPSSWVTESSNPPVNTDSGNPSTQTTSRKRRGRRPEDDGQVQIWTCAQPLDTVTDPLRVQVLLTLLHFQVLMISIEFLWWIISHSRSLISAGSLRMA